jgi:hypothetical protein
LKTIAFRDIAPCSLVEVDWRFIALMMEAVRTSEISVYFCETTRRCIFIFMPQQPQASSRPQPPTFFSKRTYSYFVKCQVLTATSVKMAVLWDVAPCSLVDINRRFTWAQAMSHPDDGGSKNLWNVLQYLSDCTVKHPTRQPPSYSQVLPAQLPTEGEPPHILDLKSWWRRVISFTIRPLNSWEIIRQ